MRVLLAYDALDGFGGTESYMLAVADQLQRTGHDVALHASRFGAVAELARDRGLRVLGTAELPPECDLVLAMDAATCLDLWARYPESVRVMVAHSLVFAHQCPPQIEGAAQAIVVLNDHTRRWAESLGWAPDIVRLRQPIDLIRFGLPRPLAGPRPRALVLSNYPYGTSGDVLRDAADLADVEIEWMGAAHGNHGTPEEAIARADFVIGLGRGVLEAMGAGRAAYVHGPTGGDGWVTPDRYDELEADGFTGRSSGAPLEAAQIARAFGEWDPGMGVAARGLAYAHHDVRDHAVELVELARRLSPHPPSPNGIERELARLVRLEWQRVSALIATRAQNTRLVAEVHDRDGHYAALRGEYDALLADRDALLADRDALLADRDALRGQAVTNEERIARLEGRVAELDDALASAHQRVLAVEATRRYRLADLLARPLDLARSARGGRRSR